MSHSQRNETRLMIKESSSVIRTFTAGMKQAVFHSQAAEGELSDKFQEVNHSQHKTKHFKTISKRTNKTVTISFSTVRSTPFIVCKLRRQINIYVQSVIALLLFLIK